MRRRVVLVTDGDEYAKRTIELLTKEFGEGVFQHRKVIQPN